MDVLDGFFVGPSGAPASETPINVDDNMRLEEPAADFEVVPGAPDICPEVPQSVDLFVCDDGDLTTVSNDDEAPGDDLRGYRKRWAQKRKVTADAEYSPSLLSEAFPPAPPPPGLARVSSSSDYAAALINSFVDRMTPSTIVMPWENDFMAPIFGSQFASAKLSMPAQWSDTFADPLKHAMPEAVPQTVRPVDFSIMKCVRNLADMDFIQSRDKQMKQALIKMKCVLEINWESSGVGRQCIDSTGTPRDDMEETLVSIIGTKSPSTVIKRCNAVLAYQRWLITWIDAEAFPFSEQMVWDYLVHLRNCVAAAAKALSFIQTLRFCQHVLQVDGAEECVASRRLVGQSEIQASLKGPTRQARPLTVAEVRKLQKFMVDPAKDLGERLMCSHLVLMVYTRSRNSDLAHVHDISHDSTPKDGHDEYSGFIQFTTRYHKSARSVETKSLLMPIIACGESVGPEPWLDVWLALRKKAGLATSGQVEGAVMPAPDVRSPGSWSIRPISCAETTRLLRAFLQCDDPDLKSHSLKRTALSWAAKAGLDREHRRLLGRHASAVQGSDSVYATDLMVDPVRALVAVVKLIRENRFKPDGDRASFFPEGNPAKPDAPVFQPKTPGTFRMPMTPAMVPRGAMESELPDREVKEEVTFPEGASIVMDEIDLVTTESETSTSGEDFATSEAEAEGELEPADANILREDEDDAWVQHKKTKVIHAIAGAGSLVSASVYANGELVQNRATKCGRLAGANFVVITTIEDWTSKCRLCFKGKRDPRANSRWSCVEVLSCTALTCVSFLQHLCIWLLHVLICFSDVTDMCRPVLCWTCPMLDNHLCWWW